MKQIKNNRGSSLAEMLVSMMIISMGMLILAGAIATAAGSNAKASDVQNTMQTTPDTRTVSITVEDGSGTKTVYVRNMKKSGELVFYE